VIHQPVGLGDGAIVERLLEGIQGQGDEVIQVGGGVMEAGPSDTSGVGRGG
jgi:hypothetical protein